MKGKRKQWLLLEQLEERIFLDANPVAELTIDTQPAPLDTSESVHPALSEPVISGEENNAASDADALKETSESSSKEASAPITANVEGEASAGEPVPGGETETVPQSLATQSNAPSAPAEATGVSTTIPTVQGDETTGDPATIGGKGETAAADPLPAPGDSDLAGSQTANTYTNTAAPDNENTIAVADNASEAPTISVLPTTEAIDPLIGENFNFTVTLDNTTAQTLYGPYIDIYFPSAGDDGYASNSNVTLAGKGLGDGLIFDSASYLGASVTSTTLVWNGTDDLYHPYAVGTDGKPISVDTTGWRGGDSLVVLEMPFGSFTPDQPVAEVTVTAHFDSHMAVDPASGPAQDQTVKVSNGFRFGATALNDPASDPSVTGHNPTMQTFRPEVIRFEKIYVGPEHETATGPNYVRQYEIAVDVAAGQTVNNLQIVEHLPDYIHFVGNVTGATGYSLSTDGHTLTVDLGNVTGAANTDCTVRFDYYVAYVDGSGNPIIPRGNGSDNDDTRIDNDMELSGNWTPSDGDDAPTPITADAEVHFADGSISTTPEIDETFHAKAIAIQKSVSLFQDTGATGYTSGDIVQYTLNFQISDYFNLGDITVTDILPDGLDFLEASDNPAYAATFSLSDTYIRQLNGNTAYSDYWLSGYDLQESVAAGDDSKLVFNVSTALADFYADYGLPGFGVLRGSLSGASDNSLDGSVGAAATGSITFYARIKESYISESGGPVTGDTSVDQGDMLTNQTTIGGTIYNGNAANPGSLTPGDTEQDTSAASLEIATGEVTKDIFAVNGQDPSLFMVDGKIHLSPGDQVTYHLSYTLPSTDFETFQLDDFLPLPVFDVDDHGWSFNGTSTTTISDPGTAPAVGVIQQTSIDTFVNDPTITFNSGANSISIVYGEYHSATSAASTIDLVFTVTVNSAPFADGLYLTNQVRAVEDGTLAQNTTTDAIKQIVLDEPVLNITKGVVETDNDVADATTPTFSANAGVHAYFTEPGTSGSRLEQTISSAWLATHDIDTNLGNVDAGDSVTFAIVVENTGHADAYDVTFRDVLPSGYTSADVTNFQVTDGAGNAIAYTGTVADFFSASGIKLDDGPGQGAIDRIDANNDGVFNETSNVLVITYDLTLPASAQPLQTLTNTATLSAYAGADGAGNHIPGGLSDDATVTIAVPTLAKVVSDTSEVSTPGSTNVVIGEVVEYTVTVTVPEGSAGHFVFSDTLDSGLAFVGLGAIDNPVTTVTYNGVNHTAENLSVPTGGGSFSIDFGTIDTGAVNSNGAPESITIVYRAVVLNTLANQQNIGLNNTAHVTWTDPGNPAGTLSTTNVSAANVVIQEPVLQIAKDVWNPVTSTWFAADNASSAVRYDAGDTVQYRITVQHSAVSGEDAFDVILNDTLPPGIDWSTATVNVASGVAPTGPLDSVTDGVFTASWDQLLSGESTTFIIAGGMLSTATAGQAITNTGTITWQSLNSDPGDISPYNSNSSERTGSGNVNDYTASNSAYITIAGTIDKIQPTPSQYAIGDTVTYDIKVTLPEGATNSLVVRDVLPVGLSFVSSSVITKTADADGHLTVDFNGALPTVTVAPVVPGDGDDITWTFNAPVTVGADNDGTNNSFLVRVTALVTDNPASHGDFDGAGPGTATTLTNIGSMSYANPQGGTTTVNDITGTPINPTITIVEPIISTTKSVADSTDAGSDAQPGETLTYTARFTNTGTSVAYEVTAEDQLPTGVHFTGLADVTNSGGIDTSATVIFVNSGTPVTGELLTISGDWDIPVGGWVEVRYTVQVLAAGFTAGTYANQVDADWSSQDGNQSNERIYADQVDGNGVPLHAVDGSQDMATANFTVLPPTGSIGDTVFFDADSSGSETPGDVGIGGVRLTLTADVDGDGNAEHTQTVLTNVNGQYAFTDLAAFSNFVITVDHDGGAGIGGTAFNLDGAGYSPTLDLDGTATAHTASGISLTAGHNRTDIDFGYTGQNSVGDRVWYDADGDGIKDSGEPGLPGLTVTISADIDGDGTFEYNATAVTDADGQYQFDHLPAGNFTVTVTQPSGVVQTSELSVDDGNIDPDLDHSAAFTLAADDDRDDIDFGYRGTAQLGDFVWEDLNGNGRQDAGEPGLEGVTVELFYAGADGIFQTSELATPLLTTITAGGGHYQFSNLAAGIYALRFGNSDGTTIFSRTGQDSLVAADATDSDANTITGLTGSYTLTDGAVINTVDAGLYRPVALGNRVYFDYDGDGVQDAGEPGITGMALKVVWLGPDGTLGGGDDQTFTTTTGANGLWQVTGLRPGSFQVTTIPPTGSGYVLTDSMDNGALDPVSPVTISTTSGNDLAGIDFGYRGTGSVGDTIWNDRNRNGIQNPGESGLAGVQVSIGIDLDGDGASDFTVTTATDANGHYLFEYLPAGAHIIKVDPSTLPAGMRPTFDPDGSFDNSHVVQLGAGEINLAVDFAYATPPPSDKPEGGPELAAVPSTQPPADGLVIDAFFLHRQFGEEPQFPFDRWLQIEYPAVPLPVAPIYTGLAEPGTTLTLVIFDTNGNEIGSQTIMADTAGNWLASFPGSLLDELPHSMMIDQRISLYNASTAGLFNLRTYFNPSFTSQVQSAAELDVPTIFAYLPSTIMETVHLSNQDSFDIRWNDFNGYEFFAPSINPARTGH